MFVYLVAGTPLKDETDIKVSTFLRNLCEEEHAEEHTQMVDSCDTQESRNYETPEANVYEFHSSGIIDMLEKLQKKFDAELHDAQLDESNAAHASSMKAQDLTDAVANGQTGVSRSKETVSSLKQEVTTSTVDRDANSKKVATDMNNLKNIDKAVSMIKEFVDKLTEQVNDEATQKDGCSTELLNELRQRQDDLKQSATEAVESGNLFGALNLLTEAVCCGCSSTLLYCRSSTGTTAVGKTAQCSF